MSLAEQIFVAAVSAHLAPGAPTKLSPETAADLASDALWAAEAFRIVERNLREARGLPPPTPVPGPGRSREP